MEWRVDGNDLLKDGASATGMFGTAAPEPVKEKEPVRDAPAEPVRAEPSSQASSGGFTQLLRALNYDQVKEQVKEAAPATGSKAMPAAPASAPLLSEGSSITQMLRVMDGVGPQAAPVAEKAAVPVASAQVTSFLPQSAPMAATPAPGGSFTQLFQTLEAAPVKEAPAPRPVEQPVSPPSSRPGSFTQLFAVPETAAPKPDVAESLPPQFRVEEAVPSQMSPASGRMPSTDDPPHPLLPIDAAIPKAEDPIPAQNPASSFTQMFQALDAPPVAPVVETAGKREASPRAVQPDAPGSFTQMFRTLSAPDAEEKALVSSPAPQVQRNEAGPSAPGSFTQMFQALGTPAVEEAGRVPAPPVDVASKAAATPGQGSFTQMFQTLSEPAASPIKTDAERVETPGSFTQLFGTAAPAPSSVPPAPSSYERPFAASAPGREEGGASQMFATYREPQPVPVVHERGFSPVEAAPMGRPPASPAQGSGGLTQLLRTLDQPTQAPKPYAAPSYPPPVAPSPTEAGSFTGVYEGLGSTPAPASAPMTPVAAPLSGVAAGPSEFTRLIQASAVREAALRGGGEVTTASGTAAGAPAGGGSGFAMPSGLPAVPKAPFSVPAAPQASVVGPEGAHAGVSAAGGGQASFAAPAMPKVPSAPPVKMPEVPKAAGAPAGIQKYVPLLLILVIFLLLAILVAVVVLMKK